MTFIFNKSSVDEGSPRLVGVDFGYRRTEVFRDLTVSFEPRALTAVVGSNGAGKSTLLSLLAGVERPRRGEVRRHAEVAFAVQRSEVTDTFPITAAEAVMMGRWRRLGLFRRPGAADRAVVEHWLTELNLGDLRHRTLGELSGGQRQRVLLAQAFAQGAPLLLLDEPTTGLDGDAADGVASHLRRLADAGTTVVAATHDARVVRAADRCVDLDEAARGVG